MGGPHRTFILGCATSVVLAFPLPLYVQASKDATTDAGLIIPTGLFYFFLGNVFITLCFPTSFALVNMSTEPEFLGRVNGIANSLYAFCRGILPVVCGWVTILGSWLGFYCTLIPAVLATLIIWRLRP